MKTFKQNIENRLTARHFKSFRLCGDVAGKDILDIGSSFGWFEKMAVEAGCKSMLGIEPSGENFYQAEKEVPGARFQVGSALEIPSKDNSFDLVVMFDVIEHIPKGTEIEAIKEIKRVLRPGGQLVLSTDNYFWLCNLLDPAWYFGHRHYKESKMARIIKAGGLTVKKTEKRGGIYELLSTILLYFSKWIFRAEPPFQSWFEKKRKQEYLTDKAGIQGLFIIAMK